MRRPAVLVIGGSDSSAGAGLVRDVRVLADFGVDALCVVTAVTAQSDKRVASIHPVPPAVVRAQIEAAFETRTPDAVKVGMLGDRATVEAVAEGLQAYGSLPLILDPVLAASSGAMLLDEPGRKAMKESLLPRALLVTPNVPEAAVLLGESPGEDEAALAAQARRILALGPRAVLLKGGHAAAHEAVDWLVGCDRLFERMAAPRVRAEQRGTGCALASAIAAQLAFGQPLPQACRRAKAYVLEQLRAAAPEH